MFRQFLDKLIANKSNYDDESQVLIDYWDNLSAKAEKYQNLKKNSDYKELEKELKAEVQNLLKDLVSIDEKTFSAIGQKYIKIMTELNARLNVLSKVDGTIKEIENILKDLKERFNN